MKKWDVLYVKKGSQGRKLTGEEEGREGGFGREGQEGKGVGPGK